jgi:hypothetical protein
MSAASSTIVANSTSTDAVTVKVVDANGNVVTNFNGTVTLAESHATVAAAVTVPGTVTITNGVGTFNATSANTTATNKSTITSSTLTSTNGQSVSASVQYGTVVISAAASTPVALALTPNSSTASSNGNTENDFTVNFNDAAGVAATPASPVYVTFTISGPGSFQQGGTAVTTLSKYVSNSGYTLPVYAIQGNNGTVTVTATASGLTSATGTFTTVQTTAPSSMTINSTTGTLSSAFPTGLSGVTLPAGTTFTKYTVQLMDSNNNPVAPTSADNLTITDNTATLADGGTLGYYSVNAAGQPSASLTSPQLPTTNGQLTFIVLNTSAGTTNPTISVKDTLLGTTVTTPYSYVTSAASTVKFTGLSTQSVQAGKTVSYSIQVVDASNNNLALSNQTVKVYFNGNGAGATLNGSSSWSSSNPYTVQTNANGIATVSVAIPSTATGSFNLDAQFGSATAVEVANTVITAGSYATTVGVANSGAAAGIVPTVSTADAWPTTSISAGTSVFSGTPAIYALNSIGQVANLADSIKVSTSDKTIVAVNGSDTATVTSSLTLPPLTALKAGTATITITDISNPDMPTVTQTITVKASSPAYVQALNPDGTYNTAYKFTSSGVSGAFTLNLVDAGGNVTPATSPTTLTSAQVLTAIGATGQAAGVRTSASGSDVSSVTIPQGQSSVVVYLDGVVSGTATAATPYTTGDLSSSSFAPQLVSGSVSGNVVTLTFNNPLTGNGNFTFNDITTSSPVTVNNTTPSGVTITFTVPTAPAHGDALTVVYPSGTLKDGYNASVTTFSAIALTNKN